MQAKRFKLENLCDRDLYTVALSLAYLHNDNSDLTEWINSNNHYQALYNSEYVYNLLVGLFKSLGFAVSPKDIEELHNILANMIGELQAIHKGMMVVRLCETELIDRFSNGE